MKIIIVVLSFFIFATTLFGLDANVKYDKVISNVEKYYYKAFTKNKIMNKGLGEFIKTTSLLDKDAKKKINTKFTFYDNKYGADSKEGAYEKIKTIIEFLEQSMFSKEEVYDILIHSTINSLDAHSSYLDKKHLQELKVQTEGIFGGLGLNVSKKEKKLIVVSALDNTPAFKAGIKSGDIILKINELSCENMSLNKAVSLLRGKVDTSVNITISRKGELILISLVREFIKIKSVDARELPNNILYLRISTFDKKVINDISKAIKNYEATNKSIILDLRNNPGGLLSEAVEVVDAFMNRGNIITQQGRSSFDKVSYDTSKEKTLTDAPLIVLINAGSASASEIVSGALQVHHRATIMGERSFGKGYVQAIFPIDEEESVKLTVAEYLLADGNSIHNIGIKPDYEIDADIVDGNDMVLEAAQDYLKNKSAFKKKYLAKAYGEQTHGKRFRNQNIGQTQTNVRK